MDSTKKEGNVPSQRFRTLRDRHDEAIVPGFVTSLSCDGLTGDCTARSPVEHEIAKVHALEYGKAGLPVVLMPSQHIGGKAERESPKGKPKIISVEKVEVVPRGLKPGPKSSKKTKEWDRPGLEQVDLTEIQDDGEENNEMEEEDQRRLTRSSSRSTMLSVQTVSDASETPGTSGKGRGRPETTGEYRVKKAKMKEMETLDRKRKLEEEIDEIMNPNCHIAPNKVAKIRNEVAEKVDHFRTAPTVDLLSRMTEAADFVMRAAIKSSHLQGVIRGELQKAHYVLAAGTTVLASRADKEEEGEHGEEVALLRIELEMAREDVRRMKEKAASDRRKLDDCLRRMEKMEEEKVFAGKEKKKRHRPAPLEDEGDEEGRTEDVAMEVAGEEMFSEPAPSNAKATVPESGPQMVLPSLEEWPAMRPPIKGVSKRLEDQAPLPPPPPKTGDSLEERILERLDRLLPKWLESKGIRIPEKDQAKPAGRKGGEKKAAAKREEQEPRPSPQTKKREAQQVGPTRKGPPPSSGKGGSGSGSPPTQGQGNREEPWTKVIGRKAKRDSQPASQPGGKKERKAGAGEKKKVLPIKAGQPDGGKKRRKPPRTAAVVLTCPEGKYGDVMRMARERVDLASLDIEGVRPRRAQTGALILEIPGKDGGSKADSLAGRLREVFENEEGVRIARPTKSAEIRLRDLDDSVTKDDILMAVAEIGNCDIMEVRIGDPQKTQDGLRAVWVRCPISAANKLAAAGKVRLGWVLARVNLLQRRPLQCFRCLQPGHVRQKCPSNTDNGDRCYRCGVSGHKAQGCSAPPKCIVCTEAGKPAGHRMGGAACPLPKRGRKVGSGEGGAARASPLKPTKTREGSNEVAMEVEEVVAPPPTPPKEKRLPRQSKGEVARETRNAS